jgi:hypothetical protein
MRDVRTNIQVTYEGIFYTRNVRTNILNGTTGNTTVLRSTFVGKKCTGRTSKKLKNDEGIKDRVMQLCNILVSDGNDWPARKGRVPQLFLVGPENGSQIATTAAMANYYHL